MSSDGVPSPKWTIAVALGTTVLAFLALGSGHDWSRGVLGGGDAWQNYWNVDHVRRSLCDGSSLFTTTRLWAPEGASLATHTLSLPLSLPAALFAPFSGLAMAYNLAVLFSFTLAGVGVFRLARRLGVRDAGAAASALCFAFAPPRFARAYGHLNLLGLGFLAFALEGLILTGDATTRQRDNATTRQRDNATTRQRVIGASEAIVSLTALVYTDLYLALLGALAAGTYAVFALCREGARKRRALTFLAIAAATILCTAPLAVRVVRDLRFVETGHESKWCSVALTSLVIPSRVQVLSAATPSLTERNHQNLVEGVGYLGWVPLVILASLFVRGRPRQADFLYISGLIALVLSLGPQPRIFDSLLPFPMPYAWIERACPPLALGGCVGRFEQLAFLPIAISVGFWIDRKRSRPVVTILALLLLCLEYLPWRIPVETWPLSPDDPALQALSRDRTDAVVFDVDGGRGALVRQTVHGHALLDGDISRRPLASLTRRNEDSVLRTLSDLSATPARNPADTAAHLQTQYRTRFVIAPNSAEWSRHLAEAGLLPFAVSPGRSLVFRTDLHGSPPSSSRGTPDGPS